MIKIKINQKKCVGCGSCCVICPDIFEIKNGKSKLKKKNIEEKQIDCAKEAAESCPMQAIEIEEKIKR